MTIHIQEIAGMTSPVTFLFAHVPKTLVILPEKLKQQFTELGKLSLRPINSTRFVCGVNVETGEIRVSVRAVEVLWVSGYVAGIYYDIARRKGGLEKRVGVNPAEHPELWKAMELYHWIINAWLDPEAEQAWPEHLPRPGQDDSADSWEAYATEQTLHSIGYLLLHEIAHVVLQHGPTEASMWSIDQEKDADRLAIDWLLTEHPDSHSPQRIKRGIAVCMALVTQVAAGMFTGKFGGESHPAKWQRLDQVMRYLEEDSVHTVFAFLSLVLPFFRAISGGKFSDAAYQDYLHAFDSFIDELSRTPPPNP